MRLFTFLSLILTVAATAAGDITSELFCLDAHTITSRSGDYALHVDPHHPTGHGPATYTFTHLGNTLWKRDYPFALYKAVITEEGLIGGAAIIEEKPELPRGSSPSTIVFTILCREGEVRLDDRIRRQDTSMSSCPPIDSRSPIVREVLLLGNDTMIADLHVHYEWDPEDTRLGRIWRRYSITEARFEKDIEIHRLRHTDGIPMYPRTTTTLPNAPLIFSEWDGFGREKNRPSKHYIYTLHNGDGDIIWSYASHEVPTDKDAASLWYDLDRNNRRRFTAENDAIFITSRSEKCTRSFSVCFNPQAETLWEVRQTGTQEWIPPAHPMSPMIKDLPAIALPHLGSTSLRPYEVETDPHIKINAFTLSDDRTIAMIRLDEVVREFERPCEGRFLIPERAVKIAAEDQRHPYTPVRLLQQPGGGWSLIESAPNAPDRISVWRYLDQPDDNPYEHTIPSLPYSSVRGYLNEWARRSTDGAYWLSFKNNLLLLVAADGRIIKEIRRTSDNTWIRPGLIAVAPDGSVAIQQPTGYAIFNADGDPITTIPYEDPMAMIRMMVRSSMDLTDFIFNGRWVVKPASLSYAVLLTGIDAPPRRLKLKHPYTRDAVAFSRDGSELLFLRDDRATIDRYALPNK